MARTKRVPVSSNANNREQALAQKSAAKKTKRKLLIQPPDASSSEEVVPAPTAKRHHHSGAVAVHDMEQQSKQTDLCWSRARIQRAVKNFVDESGWPKPQLRVTANAMNALQVYFEHTIGLWIVRSSKESAHRNAVRVDGPDVVHALDVVNHPQHEALKQEIVDKFGYVLKPIETKFEKDRARRRLRKMAKAVQEDDERKENEVEQQLVPA
jgi:histone H3/H4